MDPNLSNPNNGGVEPPAGPVIPTPHVVVPPPQPVIDKSAQAYTQSPSVSEVNDNRGQKKSHKKLIIGALILILLVVSVPITIFLTQQQQTTKSGAAQTITDATEVGRFNGQPIKVGDLRDIILEQYSQDSLHNADAIKIARATFVERKILDAKTSELGLTVDQSAIDSLANDTGLSQTQARYEYLKQQVILSQIKYVKAVSIGYWAPPNNAGDSFDSLSGGSKGIEDLITQGNSAISYAGDQLNSGQDPLTITQSIYSNPAYSLVQSSLALNGIKFSQLDDADKETAAQPVLYQFGDQNFDDQTRDKLFGTEKDKVAVSPADTSTKGETVFKVIDKGNGSFDSYNSWLAQQETIYTPVNFE